MPSTSLTGYEYYGTFIDDYSIKTWIYFLNTKSELFGKFKEFKALIENHLLEFECHLNLKQIAIIMFAVNGE